MSPGHTAMPVDPADPALSSTDVFEEACPLCEVLDRVSGKWSVQILVAVVRGPIGFTALEDPSSASVAGCSPRPCATSNATA